MNIIQKIKILFAVKAAMNKIKEAKMKSGWKTTEFWLTAISSAVSVFTAIKGLLPPDLVAKIVAIVICVYTCARAIVKVTATKADDEALDKIKEILKDVIGNQQ